MKEFQTLSQLDLVLRSHVNSAGPIYLFALLIYWSLRVGPFNFERGRLTKE